MEKIDKVILCDVDNCLIDWTTTFHGFMADKGHELVEGHPSKRRISEKYDMEHEYAESFVQEFNKTLRIRDLQPHKDALEYVLKLRDLGYDFHAITSIGTHVDTVANREYNLKDVFGADTFSSIQCIEVFGDKRPALSEWKDKKYMWIEDCPDNIQAGTEMGLYPIMIMHPCNMSSTVTVPRVSQENPWQEIYDMCEYYYSSP